MARERKQLTPEQWAHAYRRRIAMRAFHGFWGRWSVFWPEFIAEYPTPSPIEDVLDDDPIEHADAELECWVDDEGGAE